MKKLPFQRKEMTAAGARKYQKKSRTCNVEDKQHKEKYSLEKAAAQRGD
jgi:hypothetical protein